MAENCDSEFKLPWRRDPVLDFVEAEAGSGTYLCIRSYADVSRLYFGDRLLNVASGHSENMAFAERHADRLDAQEAYINQNWN